MDTQKEDILLYGCDSHPDDCGVLEQKSFYTAGSVKVNSITVKNQEAFRKPIRRAAVWQRFRLEILLALLFLLHTLFFSLAGIVSPQRMRVLGVDPICYFSYLHTIFFDRDLNFENEYRALDDTGVLVKYPLTPLGRRPNGFSLGPALAVSPFYLFAHVFVKIAGTAPADGLSAPYQVSSFVGIACYSLAGLILLFHWAKIFFRPLVAFAGTALTWFSSIAVFYAYPISFMPHAVSAFFVVLFLYYAEKTREDARLRRWILLGLFAGAMALMRWQNILFTLYLLPEIPRFRKREIPFSRIVFFLFMLVLAFIPQMVVWKRLYGQFLTVPQGGGFLVWTRPRIGSILFSTFNGLFSWTPICLLGMIGLFPGIRDPGTRRAFGLLLILFLLQLYVNSAVYDWHGSWGFGMRRFMDCLPIFVLGISRLLKLADPRKILLLSALALCLLVLWNYLFLVQYYFHLVARNRPLTFHEMVTDKLHLYRSIARRGLVNTAKASAEQGNLDDTDKAIRLALEIDPNHADIYFTAGRIAASLGETDQAGAFYREALRLGPGDRDTMRALKDLRIRQDGIRK
jgi:hypothetical protein